MLKCDANHANGVASRAETRRLVPKLNPEPRTFSVTFEGVRRHCPFHFGRSITNLSLPLKGNLFCFSFKIRLLLLHSPSNPAMQQKTALCYLFIERKFSFHRRRCGSRF